MTPSFKEIRMKVDALEKEIHLLRPILKAIHDPFFILNRKGEFLKVNLKGLELLNYSPEELQQMVFIDVVALDDLSTMRGGFDGMEKGREISLNLRVVNRLREEIPVECFGTLRGEACLITLRDLREKMRQASPRRVP